MAQTTFDTTGQKGGSWLPDWWTPERAINNWTSATSGNQGVNATQKALFDKGIDPRNYMTQDDYATAWNQALSPTGTAGVWTTGGQNSSNGGSTGQYPSGPIPTSSAAPAASGSPPRSASTAQPWSGAATPGTYGAGGNGGSAQTSGAGGTGGITPPGYGSEAYKFDPSKYLDPSMNFTMGEGLRALGSSASAQGQTFSGNTLKDILKYSQGVAGQNWGQASNTAAQQQGFGNTVDQQNVAQGNVNRNFDYQAQLNDQTIPFDQQYKTAQLGLQGSGQQSTLASVLAQILGNNYSSMGQTQGAGTVGASNSLTSAISQMLASLNQNNLYNNLFPAKG